MKKEKVFIAGHNGMVGSAWYDYLKAKITKLENEMLIIKKTIQQDDIRKQEILFLELNLLYEKKCKKTFYNKLYVKGSEDYKNCILSKGVVKKN